MRLVLVFCLSVWLLSVGSDALADAAAMVKALSGKSAVARFEAEEGLTKMGDAALPSLEPLVRTPGFSLGRRYAIHVVARIGSAKAASMLVRVLDKDPDVRVRGMVCDHVGRLGVEEAVPIIGRWLLTIRRKSFPVFRHPVVKTTAYEWLRHAHALREIGSEKGIPIIEKVLEKPPTGRAAKPMIREFRKILVELKNETVFWKAVRDVRGLEPQVRKLFKSWRRDDLALMRLYRMKVIALGTEGRWVLKDMKGHPDAALRRAAAALLKEYRRLAGTKETAQ